MMMANPQSDSRAVFEYRQGHSYELAEGRVFAPRKFEAVLGSDRVAAAEQFCFI